MRSLAADTVRSFAVPCFPHTTMDFAASFAPWARRVRVRLAGRLVLLGAGWGMLAAGVASGVAWWMCFGPERALAASIVLVGLGAGAVIARRRRWSDAEVALYLDARLKTREVVATAVGVLERDGDSPATAEVLRTAVDRLASARPERARPRLLSRWLAAGPAGAIALTLSLIAPARPVPVPVVPPGSDIVTRTDVPGLEAVERLSEVRAVDPKTAAALAEAAERARALRDALQEGVERREALSRVAQIRDDIQSARKELSRGTGGSGSEAAASALERRLDRAAAEALGTGDLVTFDEHMHRLANRAEAAARDAALEALAEAERAAARNGAGDTAAALREAQERFRQRARDAELLKELSQGLGGKLDEKARAALDAFEQSGDPEAAAELAKALAEALRSLSAEERERLARELAARAADGAGAGRALSPEELRQLAESLRTEEGRRRLAEQLRRLSEPQTSAEARRRSALDEAARGADEAARDLAGVPVPGEPCERPGGKPASGIPGSKRDEGKGSHEGQTAEVEGESLRAKAGATFDPTGASPAATAGRKPGRAVAIEGGPPEQRTLEAAAPEALRGVDRSDLPEAYREQVRRYFAP